MYSVSLSAEPGHDEQRPLDRHEVSDHRNGFDCCGVCVRPARRLVQVVADTGNLPAALALDGDGRRGSGLRPGHRLPQQRGR